MTGSTPPALGYVRPLERGPSALDAVVQRTALNACARGEGLGPLQIHDETAEGERLAFGRLVDEMAGHAVAWDGVPPSVVVATLPVLGETSLECAWRLLLLMGHGARVVFADGSRVEDALRQAWEARPDSERRRERAREGMRAQALRGVVLGRPPYGYAVEDRALVPHPRESPVVKRLFREYVDEGEGLRRIAAALNRDGIRTRLGRAWTPGSVRTVLRNPAYTGLYRRLGVVVPASHPALVDRATFHAAQRRMSERRTSRTAQERHRYLFSGLLRCGRCRGPMAAERRAVKGGVSVSYRCVNATSRGTCRAPGYRSEVIERAVRAELAQLSSTSPVAVRTAGADSSAPAEAESQRRRLERQVTEAIERWHSGEWRLHELAARVAPLVGELHDLERPAEEPPADSDEARERLLREWEALDAAERVRLLRAAVAEIVVTGDEVRVTRPR